ncbi:MAG: pyridoxal-phosphate dependent enzyme, partial [Candidatus Heimdallarchaeaceae archaeon]
VMITLNVKHETRKENIDRIKERDIIIPTFAQLREPKLIPNTIKEELKQIGLWDIHPRNLFRITWKNEPVKFGGGFGEPNYIELPPELTGVEARIIALIGKYFPTGAHKVGATFGCLAPHLVTGSFDVKNMKAVWPSTGNYCRGGAYVATLLACESVAILPEEMSRERFEWLQSVAGEIIKTPGSESNVKEIFDKVWELRRERDDIFVFNQFEEFGNSLFHFNVTGHAFKEVLEKELGGGKYRGVTLTTGSAGTIAVGDYLKQLYPGSKIAAGEALQCPTMLLNGFGAHTIEGIGDKHIPWIHNIKNTDMVIAIDDKDVMSIMRLFNEEEGHKYLKEEGVPEDIINKLDLFGLSSIANMLMAIKFAKYYELTNKDVILTVFTDSMELYQSRVREMKAKYGKYSHRDAIRDFHVSLHGQKLDNMLELTYPQRRRIHNLKYFTWIEQQGKDMEELNRQWYDENYWSELNTLPNKIDTLITQFNEEVGLI